MRPLKSGFRFGHRPGPRAQEEIQEPLTGRGVVEDIADQRRLRGFRDEAS